MMNYSKFNKTIKKIAESISHTAESSIFENVNYALNCLLKEVENNDIIYGQNSFDEFTARVRLTGALSGDDRIREKEQEIIQRARDLRKLREISNEISEIKKAKELLQSKGFTVQEN